MNRNLYLAWKRAFDIVVSTLALVALSPLMALVALAIKLDSPGPAFFRQERLGKDAQVFKIWKFRSMVVGAETMGAGLNVTEKDPRITSVGHVLRRFSLDELPQVINVLKGDMTIVGPRPGLPLHLEIYDDFQARRMEVKPGLTGLAQVAGRAAMPWSERIKLDLRYIDDRSLRLDLSIVMRTFRVVLEPKDVYNPTGGGWKPQEIPESLKEDSR
jgi:lipopolysaccharide/colanic/teichoic acid biosynthesis glycosyltransferase